VSATLRFLHLGSLHELDCHNLDISNQSIGLKIRDEEQVLLCIIDIRICLEDVGRQAMEPFTALGTKVGGIDTKVVTIAVVEADGLSLH